MLNRCPFYDKCNPTERLTFGNNEYNCMGSTSYEYCQRYRDLILIQVKEIIKDPIEELNKNIREIYSKLLRNLNEKISLAILSREGKYIYCDFSGLVDYVDFMTIFTKNNFDKMKVGGYLIHKPENDFGFYKISKDVLIAVKTQSKDLEQFEKLQSFFIEYGNKINDVIKRINQSKNAMLEKETSRISIFSVISELELKLKEDITAFEFANQLDNALTLISNRYAWNPLIYEISSFINLLKSYQKGETLKSEDKKRLSVKLKEWEKKVSNS
ncbi:MAG: hypothetical protein ACTSRG_00565 [Candidatus Helarchaeota archaeon]